MTLLRSYAFAARFTRDSRVLLLAPHLPEGVDLIAQSAPLVMWMPSGLHWRDRESRNSAWDAVRAMPSACVDRIIWLRDDSALDDTQIRDWVVECSRILDRDGTLMVRQPFAAGAGPRSDATRGFWRMADRLHAEFPWVDTGAEVGWSASSVALVDDKAGSGSSLAVDMSLVQGAQEACVAYWCLCALSREQTELWRHPTLVLSADAHQARAQVGDPLAMSLLSQASEDAAKLMTARHRQGMIEQQLRRAQEEKLQWLHQDKPELLCKVVELQDRVQWLRDQIVELERRSVERAESRTRLEAEQQELQARFEKQGIELNELKARLGALTMLPDRSRLDALEPLDVAQTEQAPMKPGVDQVERPVEANRAASEPGQGARRLDVTQIEQAPMKPGADQAASLFEANRAASEPGQGACRLQDLDEFEMFEDPRPESLASAVLSDEHAVDDLLAALGPGQGAPPRVHVPAEATPPAQGNWTRLIPRPVARPAEATVAESLPGDVEEKVQSSDAKACRSPSLASPGDGARRKGLATQGRPRSRLSRVEAGRVPQEDEGLAKLGQRLRVLRRKGGAGAAQPAARPLSAAAKGISERD